jgi:hypothetical protein
MEAQGRADHWPPTIEAPERMAVVEKPTHSVREMFGEGLKVERMESGDVVRFGARIVVDVVRSDDSKLSVEIWQKLPYGKPTRPVRKLVSIDPQPPDVLGIFGGRDLQHGLVHQADSEDFVVYACGKTPDEFRPGRKRLSDGVVSASVVKKEHTITALCKCILDGRSYHVLFHPGPEDCKELEARQ